VTPPLEVIISFSALDHFLSILEKKCMKIDIEVKRFSRQGLLKQEDFYQSLLK